MRGWAARPSLAVVVVVCVVFGSLGLMTGVSSHLNTAPGGVHSSVTREPFASPAAPAPSSSAPSGLAKALAVENGLRAKGISPTTIRLPNFAGAVTHTAQPVTPSYTEAPAPMGVADIGLWNNSGALVPYALNTTGVEGTVNITNLQSLYVDGDGPDTFGIQLNSVVNGVTIFNDSSYEFWSQNYVGYTVSTQQLVFGDEVWNFSSTSGLFPMNSVYAFSPNGTWDDFPYLYQGFGPSFTIGYPFALTLYLNTSTIADRPALYFNYTLSNATFRESSSYDYLIFNSTAGTPTQAAPTPYYQADGYNYDPIGLINDMEIDLLGNDNGDTTTFLAADATVSLEYWNATAGQMQEVPSAFNAGQETGETSDGLIVYSSGGPSPIGIVRTGPSLVGGLWNYSSSSGAVPLTLNLQPANAFVFVNLGSTGNVSTSQWVPTSPSGTTMIYLPTGGTYFFDFLLSDYTPTTRVLTPTVPLVRTVHLVGNPLEGVYTPLLAFDNAELAAISSSGSGTAATPYVLVNNQYGSLAPQFAQWNDYLFPVFPGLLLAGTSAWVTVTPPSWEIDLPSWDFASPFVAALGLPLTNNLQIQFYDASNISLVHAPGISGWMAGFLYEFPESSLMLWGCTNVLVASNMFLDQGNALLLYGGSNNTVWGNTFVAAPIPAGNPASVDDSGVWLTGVNETESGDLLYNNLFNVVIPATTPTVDPFPCDQYGYCYPVTYTDTWNVSEQPATNSSVVNGWTLTGSIVGTWYEGGNYWSNYGTTLNPYGVIPLAVPYNDSGQITAGGDYVPLVPFALYPVTIEESGLAMGAAWNVTLNGVLVPSNLSNPTAIEVESPNGTFGLSVAGPAGYVVTAPSEISVQGAPVTVDVSFAALVTIQVQASGLGTDVEWSASINGTGTGNTTVTEANDTPSMIFEAPSGTYNVTAAAFGYSVAPPFVPTTVGPLGATVNFTFTALPGVLALHVSPYNASVWVDGQAVILAAGAGYVSVPAGEVAVIATAFGYYPYSNNVTVTRAGVSYLNITLNPLPSSSSSGSSGYAGISAMGWVLVGALAALAVIFLVGMIYFARRGPKGSGPAGPPPAQEWQESPPPSPPPT